MDLRDAHLGIQAADLDHACTRLHHLGFWVDDVEAESARLAEAGYPVEAGGLDETGRYRCTYHDVAGLRIEIAGATARPAFERWAVTGRSDGAAAAFNCGAQHQDEGDR